MVCEAAPPEEDAVFNEASLPRSELLMLQAVRREFNGFPGGVYFDIQQEKGIAAAYAQVRADYPELTGYSDEKFDVAFDTMGRTFEELFIYSPLGPFVILSSIAIFRDGLSIWGIPPCREYLGLCTTWSPWLPFPLPFALPGFLAPPGV